MVFPENAIGARVFPHELAASVTEYYRGKGVTVVPQRLVAGLERSGSQSLLRLTDLDHAEAESIAVDHVVAGLGILPNVALAEQAGLTADNGIVVDDLLITSAPDVYAAGDVAAFFNPALGRRMRVEHEDNANTMGRLAGRNMAGAAAPYDHLPFFYSDLFDLGYEAVGELDARLQTFEDWKEPFREGVVYYLTDGRVRGALLWNVWEKKDAARELIAKPGPFAERDLRGRLF